MTRAETLTLADRPTRCLAGADVEEMSGWRLDGRTWDEERDG